MKSNYWRKNFYFKKKSNKLLVGLSKKINAIFNFDLQCKFLENFLYETKDSFIDLPKSF